VKRIVWQIFYVLLLAGFTRGCVVEPVRVADDVMAPVLWDGDVVLISKLAYGLRVPGSGAVITNWHHIEKGDLVLISGAGEPQLTAIRRVLLVPGETAEIPLSEGGGTRKLRSDEYLVTMDQEPKEPGVHGFKVLVPRRGILGKAWRIWIPAESKVESGKPRKFFQRL
jgi:signal peptidase I